MKTRTALSIGILTSEFFFLPTLRIDETRLDRSRIELCWLNMYAGIIRDYWED